MWTLPEGWTIRRVPGGAILTHDDRSERVVVHDGLAPVGQVDALIASVAIPDLVLERVSRTVTCEGERALLASARAGDAPLELGFALFDDTYLRVIARVDGDRATIAALVRQLVVSARAFLGACRRRKFWYEPPRGWTLAADGSGDDTWLAPDYPTHRAAITVPRALPVTARDEVSMVRELLDPGPLSISTPFVTRRGLTGRRWDRTIYSDDDRELALVVIAISDGAYDYVARAIVPHDEVPMFDALVESIEPVVSIPDVVVMSVEAFAHWAS